MALKSKPPSARVRDMESIFFTVQVLSSEYLFLFHFLRIKIKCTTAGEHKYCGMVPHELTGRLGCASPLNLIEIIQQNTKVVQGWAKEWSLGCVNPTS